MVSPLALGILPAVLGWRLVRTVGRTVFSPSGAVAGLTVSKALFAQTVRMKQEQEIVIQQQLEQGELTVVVPYDDDTLNKLFVISVLPELAFLAVQAQPQNLARTEVVIRALLQTITPNLNRYRVAPMTINGFPLTQSRTALSSVGLRNQLNSLAIVLDYIETEKLSTDGGWQEILEQEGKRNAILQSVDDLTTQISDLDLVSYGIDGTGDLLDEKMEKALRGNLSLYPVVDRKNSPYFVLSRISDFDVDYEFDEEGLPSQSVSGGQKARIEQIYVDVNESIDIDGKQYYNTWAWVDDEWEVLGQISEFDEAIVDGETVFKVGRKQVQEDVAESVIGRLAFTQALENEDELRRALARNPQIGRVYTAQSGALFTAKTVAGRLLWIDTAILLGTGAISLFVPQVKPFSPIGEGLTALFGFVGRTLDLNADELVPELDKINLDAGVFAIASQLFALDEIQAKFEPTADSIVEDLNLDGRTFGYAISQAGINGSLSSLRRYATWESLTVLAIVVIIVGLLRQIPSFFKR